MLVRDPVLQGAALGTRPGRHVRAGFVERHVLAGGVAGGRDRQRGQVPAVQQVRNAVQRQLAVQQLQQWRVVEQRARPAAVPAGERPAQGQQAQPACAAAHDAESVRPVDLAGAEVAPHARQALHGAVEVVGAAGQRCGVDRAGRGAHGDREWRGSTSRARVLAQAREGLQHPDLVGGTRSAAGQHDGGWRGRDAMCSACAQP